MQIITSVYNSIKQISSIHDKSPNVITPGRFIICHITSLREAKRCLVTNGILMIAETTKSMKGRLLKLRDVIKAEGFETYLDEERADFTFIEAREL